MSEFQIQLRPEGDENDYDFEEMFSILHSEMKRQKIEQEKKIKIVPVAAAPVLKVNDSRPFEKQRQNIPFPHRLPERDMEDMESEMHVLFLRALQYYGTSGTPRELYENQQYLFPHSAVDHSCIPISKDEGTCHILYFQKDEMLVFNHGHRKVNFRATGNVFLCRETGKVHYCTKHSLCRHQRVIDGQNMCIISTFVKSPQMKHGVVPGGSSEKNENDEEEEEEGDQSEEFKDVLEAMKNDGKGEMTMEYTEIDEHIKRHNKHQLKDMSLEHAQQLQVPENKGANFYSSMDSAIQAPRVAEESNDDRFDKKHEEVIRRRRRRKTTITKTNETATPLKKSQISEIVKETMINLEAGIKYLTFVTLWIDLIFTVRERIPKLGPTPKTHQRKVQQVKKLALNILYIIARDGMNVDGVQVLPYDPSLKDELPREIDIKKRENLKIKHIGEHRFNIFTGITVILSMHQNRKHMYEYTRFIKLP